MLLPTPDPDDPDDPMVIAIHEAGHACIAHALGIEVTATERTRVGLHCDDDPGPLISQSLAVIMIAGPWAERRYCNYSDEEIAQRWGSHWSVDLRNCRRYLREIDRWFHLLPRGVIPMRRIETFATEQVDQHWAWITRVAEALNAQGELKPAELDRLRESV
jgi:hypothetical protein